MNDLNFGNLKVSYDDSTNRVVFRNERAVCNDRKSYDYAYLNKSNIEDVIEYLETIVDGEDIDINNEKDDVKLIIREENMDLFTVPQGYYLAHCISNDFALGAGIAVQFDKIYNMRYKLNKIFEENLFLDRNCVGKSLLIDNVFNLVTKEKAYQKPTYENLQKSLIDMKNRIEELSIQKLAIPQIGCGLDKLDWDIVKEIIEEIFNDMDIEILVCIL